MTKNTLPKAVLFDLDGTLTDPKEGITNSILFALEKMGVSGYSQDSLEWCIGPPLLASFEKILDGDTTRANLAVEHYREYYKPTGMYENSVYPGIVELLTALKNSRHRLFVATSKPEIFAKKVLDHFNLSSYFEGIYGSELNGTRSNKGELIAYVITQENLLQNCVMIGDREHDIIGAKQNNIDSIGVTWGYGDLQELQQAAPEHICNTTEELLNVILQKI